jgi:NAD(P)-dependent dehydrogenase (short-subunit alcohol dehydrogenase family)
MNGNYDLSGKSTLITGAAGLLGGQHARAILQHGGAVVLTDVDQAGLERESGILARQYGQGRV